MLKISTKKKVPACFAGYTVAHHHVKAFFGANNNKLMLKKNQHCKIRTELTPVVLCVDYKSGVQTNEASRTLQIVQCHHSFYSMLCFALLPFATVSIWGLSVAMVEIYHMIYPPTADRSNLRKPEERKKGRKEGGSLSWSLSNYFMFPISCKNQCKDRIIRVSLLFPFCVFL